MKNQSPTSCYRKERHHYTILSKTVRHRLRPDDRGQLYPAHRSRRTMVHFRWWVSSSTYIRIQRSSKLGYIIFQWTRCWLLNQEICESNFWNDLTCTYRANFHMNFSSRHRWTGGVQRHEGAVHAERRWIPSRLFRHGQAKLREYR